MEKKKLNPWLSMWMKPRDTIQEIIDEDPYRLVILLAALWGFSEQLSHAAGNSHGDSSSLATILLVAVIGGSIMGIVVLYIWGALLRWTGKWLGGKATPENIRAAVAWSSIPKVWALALWIPGLAIFGQDLFTSDTSMLDESIALLYTAMVLGAIWVTIWIWTFVVFLKCLGQVQGFSAWKALSNTILAGLTPFAIFAAVFIFLPALLDTLN
jgi:hypothetical protein